MQPNSTRVSDGWPERFKGHQKTCLHMSKEAEVVYSMHAHPEPRERILNYKNVPKSSKFGVGRRHRLLYNSVAVKRSIANKNLTVEDGPQ